MRKIMIVSTKFRWYGDSFADAFRMCGCDVLLCKESVRVEKSDFLRYLKYRTHLIKAKDYDDIRNNINRRVIEKFNNYKPDLFLVVMGNQITPETLKYINLSCPTAVVLTDTREAYPFYDSVVPLYTKSYTYEITNLTYYKSIGANIDSLFGLVDEKMYFPIDNVQKRIDISFVGFMNAERKALLEKIYNDFPGLKMEFWGQYLTSHNPIAYFHYFFSKKKNVFKNKVIHYSKVNEIYNASKICLNLNGVQSVEGWGSRLTEILGTKSFQIVKENLSIKKEFNNCLATYKSYEELKTKITFFLKNPEERARLSTNGYSKAINYFTYKQAARKILRDFYE